MLVSPERALQLPQDAILVDDYRFASGLQLGGYAITSDRIRLYMRATQPLDEPLFAWVITYDEAGQPLEECAMTAGGVWWSTVDWQPNEWVAQDFTFPHLGEAKTFDLRVFYLQNNYQLINAYDANRPDERLSGSTLELKR